MREGSEKNKIPVFLYFFFPSFLLNLMLMLHNANTLNEHVLCLKGKNNPDQENPQMCIVDLEHGTGCCLAAASCASQPCPGAAMGPRDTLPALVLFPHFSHLPDVWPYLWWGRANEHSLFGKSHYHLKNFNNRVFDSM